MRTLFSLLFLLALSISPVVARMNQLVSRTSHDHPAIARRQHHPTRASLIDICASIDASFLSRISAAGILEASASVEAHLCICISAVPVFVKADVRAKGFVDHVGEQNAIVRIREMINAADRRQSCHFPPHSAAILSVGTSCDPCEYRCEDTYQELDGQCVCHAPAFECNGKCALVSHSQCLSRVRAYTL
ncbi:hypothetical protein BJ322DRAFT_1048806 [Thelephora terrestris]|uniref:Uncharacterized protein n=1 Tax=Thelephora terrestris TaxID=56493 RepID=A0A9P6HJA8_9AGAM|nr:hypothetical protein BJ322DRAFT_1048806 [Thelephora terrestris]